MPYFYNSNNKEFGKISVTPTSIFRRFKIGSYSLLPYVTMSKIRFTLRVERLPQRDQNVYIQLGDGSYRFIKTIQEKKTLIEGMAEYTGDTKFFIAPAGYFDKNSERFIAKEGILLFDDNVLSINNYVWGGCSVAALVLIICSIGLGLLSGFIEVNPALRLFIK